MGKQLATYTTPQGTILPTAYARIIRPAMPRTDNGTGDSATQVSCDFSIYDSKASREAGKPPYLTQTVILYATDPLFASTFGAAPSGGSTFADLYAKSYAMLSQHPDTSVMFAGSADV